VPQAELAETDSEFKIRVNVPGFDAKDLRITAQGEILIRSNFEKCLEKNHKRRNSEMIRILIVDDCAILRRGLKKILVHELPGVVCGEAEDARQVLAQIQSRDRDIVMLDITMPGRSGREVLKDVKVMRPKLPVLILSTHSEDQYGKRVFRAGASGYMSKQSAPEELINAIRKLLAGGQYVSPALAENLALDLKNNAARSAR
jgi:two-component system, NarL family, invasion response regulator UvrY